MLEIAKVDGCQQKRVPRNARCLGRAYITFCKMIYFVCWKEFVPSTIMQTKIQSVLLEKKIRNKCVCR